MQNHQNNTICIFTSYMHMYFVLIKNIKTVEVLHKLNSSGSLSLLDKVHILPMLHLGFGSLMWREDSGRGIAGCPLSPFPFRSSFPIRVPSHLYFLEPPFLLHLKQVGEQVSHGKPGLLGLSAPPCTQEWA